MSINRYEYDALKILLVYEKTMKKECINQTWPIPHLISQTIRLRPCRLTDYEQLKTYRQDNESCKFIRPPQTDEQIKKLVEQHCEPWDLSENRWNALIINLVDSDVAIGEVLFRYEDIEHERIELGYRVAPEAAGRGVATEACRLLINYLFNNFQCHKIVAKCDPRNIASFRVMEKLGMVREASFKRHFKIGDLWTDQYDYGILIEDWSKLER